MTFSACDPVFETTQCRSCVVVFQGIYWEGYHASSELDAEQHAKVDRTTVLLVNGSFRYVGCYHNQSMPLPSTYNQNFPRETSTQGIESHAGHCGIKDIHFSTCLMFKTLFTLGLLDGAHDALGPRKLTSVHAVAAFCQSSILVVPTSIVPRAAICGGVLVAFDGFAPRAADHG